MTPSIEFKLFKFLIMPNGISLSIFRGFFSTLFFIDLWFEWGHNNTFLYLWITVCSADFSNWQGSKKGKKGSETDLWRFQKEMTWMNEQMKKNSSQSGFPFFIFLGRTSCRHIMHVPIITQTHIWNTLQT